MPITREVIEGLINKLGMPPPGPFSQDWEYEIADSEKLGEWLQAYSSVPLTHDERETLMETILDSYEDAMRSNAARAEDWETIRRHLIANREIHRTTIDYWSLLDEPDPENCFLVTHLVREVRSVIEMEIKPDLL